MLTPLERELLQALKNASKALSQTSYCGTVPHGKIEHFIARAETAARQSAQAEHDRMIALRRTEDGDGYLPVTKHTRHEAGPDDGLFLDDRGAVSGGR